MPLVNNNSSNNDNGNGNNTMDNNNIHINPYNYDIDVVHFDDYDIDILHEDEIYTNDRKEYLESVSNPYSLLERRGHELLNRVRQLIRNEVIGRNVDNVVTELEGLGWSSLQIQDMLIVWERLENPFHHYQMVKLQTFIDDYEIRVRQECPNVFFRYLDEQGDDVSDESDSDSDSDSDDSDDSHSTASSASYLPDPQQHQEIAVLPNARQLYNNVFQAVMQELPENNNNREEVPVVNNRDPNNNRQRNNQNQNQNHIQNQVRNNIENINNNIQNLENEIRNIRDNMNNIMDYMAINHNNHNHNQNQN